MLQPLAPWLQLLLVVLQQHNRLAEQLLLCQGKALRSTARV